MLAYDLFCGAGGASIGLQRAGYEVLGFDNWDRAVATHRACVGPAECVAIEDVDWSAFQTPDLLWGSPPCQPFSQGGRNTGEWDARDGVPHFIDAVALLSPSAFIMENVKGLTYTKHQPYLQRVVKELDALGYEVEYKVLNAADYGVPQKRLRLFMQGRNDGLRIQWPRPTHSSDSGPKRELGFHARWRTMADALGWDESVCRMRALHGAEDDKALWPMTNPACTVVGTFRPDLMAPPEFRQDPKIPRQKSLGVVSITESEAAVLQGFPREMTFEGPKTSRWLMLGNAVAVDMAELLGHAALSA